LNGNYYNEEDGHVWHVPAFCGFSHACPGLRRNACGNG
jgi:hypothetical protein